MATKGDEVEEWLDLRFFRPVGALITRAVYPTRITPDQLTLASLIVGLVAGHLFMYTGALVNFVGFALFIVSDVFDSADGQLARMRRTSTRFGRVLDGVSDTARFLNLGAHLVVRLALHGGWPWTLAVLLVAAAAVSHSTQSATIDFVRHAYLAIVVGKGSELDLDGLPTPTDASIWRRVASWAYRVYGRRQARLFPRTVALLRAERENRVTPEMAALYRGTLRQLLPWCAGLGQNLRFLVLGATAIAGWPAGLLWVTVIPMNLLAAALVLAQEHRAARVLDALRWRTVPPAPAPPTVAVSSG